MADISLIIPAYNVEKYVTEAVESVLCQTLLPFEVIIINDGSTDSTVDKLKKYEKNSIVKIFHTKNNGLGPARNFGIEKAKGDYLYFLDSDDKISFDFIEKIQKQIYKENNPDIIFFSGNVFIDEGFETDYIPNYKRNIDVVFFKKDYPIRKMQKNKCFYSSSCLYVSKKEIWNKNNIRFKNIYHEDEEVIFPITSYSNKIIVINDVFLHRRLRHGSIMTSLRNKKYLDSEIIIIKSLFEFHRQNKYLQYYDFLAFKVQVRKRALNYVKHSAKLSIMFNPFFILYVALKIKDFKLIFQSVFRWLQAFRNAHMGN